MTTEEFIIKANNVHNGKYDYSKVEYVNAKTKVCIICPKHGEFWQTPHNHLQGQGCPKCSPTLKLNKDVFIENSNKKHNGKYDYSKVEYVNSHTKVCIICPEHGEFWQLPSNHLYGNGCPKCANLQNSERLKSNTNAFIEKAKEIHGNKYDYSSVNYINNQTNVCIICPEHGEFWQTPYNHLSGKGCIMCGIQNNADRCRSNTEEFVEKAKEIHKGKYDYSNVNYGQNNQEKVCIICYKHGEFWQSPLHHLNGCGCPKCAVDVHRSNKGNFVELAKKIHSDKYDYSKVDYKSSQDKICIICPEHGEFWQKPSTHLDGCGCPICGYLKRTSNTYEFIQKAKEIHQCKYNYSKVEYVNSHTKVCIICPKHGEFYQEPRNHLEGKGCPKCGQIISVAEDELMQVLQHCNPQWHNRTILNGKELDVYIPSLKLGIEYNGLRWHSEEFGKGHRYHLDKLNECNKQSIRLIQIFEDEWVNHREICESKLKQICGLNTNPKIFGRKCEIREITKKNEAYEFLDKNHIQGRTGCTVALGAYYADKLVGVMTFKKEKEGYWDLNRFATDINYHCIGVGGKLLKYFTNHYDFQEIKSFADRRWTTDPTDNLYTKLGFKFDSFVEPTYWYYNPKVAPYRRFHKFGFRKQPLHNQYGLPLTMTEREMTTALGYVRIWDCGLIKYVYKIFGNTN